MVIEKRFYNHLCIVKSAFDSQVVNVRIQYCSHLHFLYRADSSFRMKHKYIYTYFALKAIDCGAACITGSCSYDSQWMMALV